MKNTKLTFYCTQFQQGNFEKIVFDTILEGEDINDLSDAKQWLDNSVIGEIYDEFDLDVVFDWVIINLAKTKERCSPIREIKRIDGKLSFTKKRILKPKETSSKYFLSPKEYSAKLTRLAAEKAEAEGKPAPPPKKEYRSCWIDPSGKTHWVGFAMHNEYASDWLERHDNVKYKKILESWGRYHYEELEDQGWLKILGWTDPPQFVLPDRIGPKQKQAIREYCISQKVSYEFWPEILKS
jgi:hypothetical protein